MKLYGGEVYILIVGCINPNQLIKIYNIWKLLQTYPTGFLIYQNQFI